jgi:cardiolipin synthase A/B
MFEGFFDFANIWSSTLLVLNIIYFTTAIFISLSVILDNRNPSKTISWIIVLFVLPFIGLLLYLFFGQNYRKEKIYSRKGMEDFHRIRNFSDNQLIELFSKDFLSNEKIRSKLPIITLLMNNSKALLTEKNRVSILNNGRRTFQSIFTELRKAKNHIHLEYYIIDEDKLGNELKDILIEKATEGLEVRLIYDDVGCWRLSKKFLNDLSAAGVEHHPFMPVRFPYFANRINYRNHRKIVVIDGKVGFVGGLNIADRYLYGNKKLGPWRDTHLKIEGEAVNALQVVFLIDWQFVSGQTIKDIRYFPKTRISNTQLVQITASGPDSDWASIMQAYFAAISTAQQYIYISNPYFIPNESILTALKTASLSGVDVRIILPGESDAFLTYYSSLSYVQELLEANIRVFFYRKGFIHSKLILVDDVFSSVGTANMDMRSFDDNFEVNALIYDEEICLELRKSFFDDILHSEEVVLNEFRKRSLRRKLTESVSRIFSPLL